MKKLNLLSSLVWRVLGSAPAEGIPAEDSGKKGQSGLEGAIKGAAAGAKSAASQNGAKSGIADGLKAASNIVAKATGTGQTTGHITDITLTNPNDFPIKILPQTFYIPYRGQYLDYVDRIAAGNTIPPNGTSILPVIGRIRSIKHLSREI